MDNYFTLLGMEQEIHLDLELLTKNHQQLAAQHHPDKGGDENKYRLINTAFSTLKTPSKRIMHLMDILNIQHDKRGTVSDQLMDLFMSTAQLLQETDAFLRKKSAATSALAKALLENESQQFQEHLSNQINIIGSETAQKLQTAEVSDSLAQTARDLAFLEKWQAQLKERYASLF